MMKKNIRWLLRIVILCACILFIYKKRIVFDVSRLSPTVVSNVIKPKSVDELQHIIRTKNKPISFAGGRFSQGGQVAYPQGLVIDTTRLNRIIAFDSENKRITVQPGITWRDIQSYIDPYDLAVQVMQSYNDFTVGGSLGVNVHGRDPMGSLIKTVQSIKMLMPDGSLKIANRDENKDLFDAAIGGYGLLGPIVEATLQLTDNQKIARDALIIPLQEYPNYFCKHIYANEHVVFHNANVYPNEFEEVLAITWYKTDDKLTVADRLQKKGLYLQEKIEKQLLRRFSPLKKLRQQIEPKRLKEREIVWRNYEMSYSVESLEPFIRFPTTSILQEYFIPLDQLVTFIEKFKAIVHEHAVNVLNVSIRYVAADHESVLAYAPKESFALVCYFNVLRTVEQVREQKWTRALINAALLVGGAFYLPYHLYATKEQFQKAYPRFNEFLAIKKRYDPDNRFINLLYKEYMSS